MGQRRISRVAIWLLTAAACTSVGIGAAGVASAAATPAVTPHVKTASVKIVTFAFKPRTLNITAHTIVTWTNNDSTGHDITFAAFHSKILATGATYSHKFGIPGTYKYHCNLHPEMTGKVVVT